MTEKELLKKLEKAKKSEGREPASDKALDFITGPKVEGGVSSDTTDRGNYNPQGEFRPTNHGITNWAFKKYFGYEPSSEDMRNLSKEEAENILRKDYLYEYNVDAIENPKVRAAVLDYLINSGPQAIRDLQRSLNVPVDRSIGPGSIGPQTLSAIGALDDEGEEEFLDDYLTRRTDLIENSPRISDSNKQGLYNRIGKVYNYINENMEGPEDIETMSEKDTKDLHMKHVADFGKRKAESIKKEPSENPILDSERGLREEQRDQRNRDELEQERADALLEKRFGYAPKKEQLVDKERVLREFFQKMLEEEE